MLGTLLAVYLVVVLPCRQLAKHRQQGSATPRSQRYVNTLTSIAAPLAVLVLSARQSHFDATALGLGVPLSVSGECGLAFAVLLLAVMAIAGSLWEQRLDDGTRAEHLEQIRSNDIMPRTPAELGQFLFMTSCMGAGWELLYRGFLLLVLSPVVGVIGAVVLSALAYALSHGYRSQKQLVASIVSAFFFTVGFALTHSLWWLMLVHIGLPAHAAISAYRSLRAAPAAAPGHAG